jgi:hypothetical protein
VQVSCCNELWGERSIRDINDATSGHVTQKPEVRYANCVAVQHALSACVLKQPALALLDKSVKGRQRAAEKDGPQYDCGTDTCLLMGAGTLPEAGERSLVVELAVRYIKDFQPQGWDQGAADTLVEEALESKRIHVYKMADLRKEEVIKVEAAFRGTARQNCYMLVTWEVNDVILEYLCVATIFLRVQHPTCATADVLRLAGVRVYNRHPMEGGMGVAIDAELAPDADLHRCYPVALDGIKCKVAVAHPSREFNDKFKGKLYSMTFANLSRAY